MKRETVRERRSDSEPFRLRGSRRALEPRAERDEDVDIAAMGKGGGSLRRPLMVGVGGGNGWAALLAACLPAWDIEKRKTARGKARVASSAGWFLCPFGTSVLVCYVCVGFSLVAAAVRVGLAGIRWLRSKSLVMVVVL